jgi:nucleoside-diphosphate-sugar epimerase
VKFADQRLGLIIGTGDLGSRVANLLNGATSDVITVSRGMQNPSHSGQHYSANVITGEGLRALPVAADLLVYCVAPDERTEAAYREVYLNGLQRVLAACKPQRLVFIGSTAVYAQDAGEWVDETSVTEAESFNGRVLRECEALCRDYAFATALRLSGIYGPGREAMLRRARAGEAGRPHWVNRVHVDDAAHAIAHVANMQNPDGVYCVTDSMPVLEQALLVWLRDPALAAPMDLDGPSTGRRVSNQRLLATGWKPEFASYQASYLS